MTTKPQQPTVASYLADHQKRIKRLEAMPNDGGGSGSCSCQCQEPDGSPLLAFNFSNWIGYVGDGFSNPIDNAVADSTCFHGGYVHDGADADGAVAHWTVWLGPTGARFNIRVLAVSNAGAGKLGLKAEKLEEVSPGIWERGSASLIDIWPGSPPIDMYTPPTVPNQHYSTYTFGIEGADCDTPFTAVDDSPSYGYGLDGGPGRYRLWLYVDGKNGSSSGYAALLQQVVLIRNNGDG